MPLLSFLKDIIDGKNCMLGHFINIGYQTQLNDQQVVNRLKERHAELVRIGEARKSIHLTEPLIRDSDAIIFDMSSVRQSDAPGTISPSPNGFYGEEICLLARYAGISDNLSLFALFDVDPDVDFREQTTGLAAQVVWFFWRDSPKNSMKRNFWMLITEDLPATMSLCPMLGRIWYLSRVISRTGGGLNL